MTEHRTPQAEPPPSDQPRSGAGLRPAVSAAYAGSRLLDVSVVAVSTIILISIAGAVGAMSFDASIGISALIVIITAIWLRVSPATRPMRRVEVPLPQPSSARAQFPLTPETGVAIIERLPDPIILLDRSGRIILHNRAAMNIVGEAAARRHISTVMRVPEVLEAVAHVSAGEAAQVVEFAQPVPIERHYHAFIAPIAASPADQVRDRHQNVLILLHDLTTLKRAEQMRADFVANASHELRTPLSSLAGFVETLQGPARDDPAARDKFLSIMQEQAERMGRLINDLLSLSRIELNEHVRPVNRVDLASIVNDTEDMLTPLAQKEGVTIKVEIEPDLPHPFGDRDELVQVCQNLLANAIKYGSTGGRVDVTVRKDVPAGMQDSPSATSGLAAGKMPGSIVMEFRDYGPGIAREHLPRLTERFYRVDVEQSRRRGGTGLGLAIVKHIVNRHMGSLSIDSEIGKGSTFKVFLPVDPRGAQTDAADPVTKPATPAAQRPAGRPATAVH